MNVRERIKLLFKHNSTLTCWKQLKGGYQQVCLLGQQFVDRPRQFVGTFGEMCVALTQCALLACCLIVSPVTIAIVFTNHVRRDYIFQRQIIDGIRRRDMFAPPVQMWHILYTRYQITRLPFYNRLVKIVTREIAHQRLHNVDRVYDDLVNQWINKENK